MTYPKLDKALPSDNRTLGWGSDVAAEMLRRLGVKYITHNPGSSFRGLHDSIVNYAGNKDPSLLLCLNENQAVAIAHGYAKVTGEPMGVIVHANVGLLNAAMSIYNAWVDRAPIFLVGAGGPSDADRRIPWIHWIHSSRDQAGYVRGFTKWDDEPRSPQAMVESMLRAHQMARTAPKGPVYVVLDALLQEDALRGAVQLPDVSRYDVGPQPAPPSDAVEQAADMLLAARHPMILCGRVSRDRGDWDRRVRLAELIGARVATDIKTGASFPTDHALHAGLSYHFRGPQKDVLAQSDVVLGLDWVDFASALKAGFPDGTVKARVIQCSVDSYAHNAMNSDSFGLPPSDLRLLVEPDIAVRHILAAIERRLQGKPPRAPGTKRGMISAPSRSAGDPITVADIGYAMHAARAKRKITLARLPLGFAAETCHFDDPLDHLGNDGGVGIGSGLGNTIGTALALRESDRVVAAVIGDSDFCQGATAVWTAAHYGIPALVVVVNNRSHLNDELIQERLAIQRGRERENRWIGQRIDDPPVDISSVARGFGAQVEGPVSTVGALGEAIESGFAHVAAGRFCVIDAQVVEGSASRLAESGG
jgi:thiamine pyrophosphate-dependent acetolactate synthase large subunit-like protein